jgi:two-component system chemotaxis response regulator CheY
MRILIADDDFVSRNLLARCVRDLGPADLAAGGEEAWSAYLDARESDPYGLILLDIVMPGMDGAEVLRRIRADERARDVTGPRRCAIAMATVLSDKDAVIGSFRAEADGYILKPFSPESVRRDLRTQNLIGPA